MVAIDVLPGSHLALVGDGVAMAPVSATSKILTPVQHDRTVLLAVIADCWSMKRFFIIEMPASKASAEPFAGQTWQDGAYQALDAFRRPGQAESYRPTWTSNGLVPGGPEAIESLVTLAMSFARQVPL
jgi:hypothetical protein